MIDNVVYNKHIKDLTQLDLWYSISWLRKMFFFQLKKYKEKLSDFFSLSYFTNLFIFALIGSLSFYTYKKNA